MDCAVWLWLCRDEDWPNSLVNCVTANRIHPILDESGRWRTYDGEPGMVFFYDAAEKLELILNGAAEEARWDEFRELPAHEQVQACAEEWERCFGEWEAKASGRPASIKEAIRDDWQSRRYRSLMKAVDAGAFSDPDFSGLQKWLRRSVWDDFEGGRVAWTVEIVAAWLRDDDIETFTENVDEREDDLTIAAALREEAERLREHEDKEDIDDSGVTPLAESRIRTDEYIKDKGWVWMKCIEICRNAEVPTPSRYVVNRCVDKGLVDWNGKDEKARRIASGSVDAIRDYYTAKQVKADRF